MPTIIFLKTLFLNKRLLIYEDNNNNQKSNISKQINSKEICIYAIHFRRVILTKIMLPKVVAFCSNQSVEYDLFPFAA